MCKAGNEGALNFGRALIGFMAAQAGNKELAARAFEPLVNKFRPKPYSPITEPPNALESQAPKEAQGADGWQGEATNSSILTAQGRRGAGAGVDVYGDSVLGGFGGAQLQKKTLLGG